MISYLSGIMLDSNESSLIIDVNGVGYSVAIPKRIQDSLSKIGDKVKLYIYSSLNVRDGTFVLYGFENLQELRFFELLISVSGIGPKNAQNILSNIDVPTLQLAIVKGDDQYLKKLSGIGSKTAKRIILDLQKKVMETDLGSASKDRDFQIEGEAIDALVALGYSVNQGREALKEISKKAKSSEDKIKEALKFLGNNK